MNLEPVPTAHVGLGSRGMRYMKAAHWVGGFRPVALVDTDPDRFAAARQFSDLYADACFGSLQDALAASEIAAVFVAAPESAHADLIRQALEAGAHVFTETPFTTAYADAAELVHTAAENDRAIVVAHQYRLAAVERTIAKLLEQGSLGAVGFGYLRHDLQRVTADPNGEHARAWEIDVHNIDSLVSMLPARPRRLSGRFFTPAFSDAAKPSSLHATFEFEDGAVVQYLASADGHRPDYRFRLECEAGTLEHRAAHPARGDDAAELVQIAPDGSEQPVRLDPSYDDAWLEETLAIFFKDYFRDGQEPEVSGRHNLMTMGVMQALLRSSETGQAVNVADIAPEAFHEPA